MSELRRRSEQEFADLISTVRDRKTEAVRAGLPPSEVWLGPKEARIFEVEMNWQSVEGRLIPSSANASAMISGDMEGAQLMGFGPTVQKLKTPVEARKQNVERSDRHEATTETKSHRPRRFTDATRSALARRCLCLRGSGWKLLLPIKISGNP